MKKIILYITLFVVFVAIALFIFESIRFENYITAQQMDGEAEMNIPVNKDAPVISDSEIIIDAPKEKVWQILTTINDWPEWQTEVTESNLKGELREGAEFKWKAGRLSFTSKIHTIEPKNKFGWTGETFGASAIHNWFFKDKGEKTIIYVEESLQGVFPLLFKSYFQRNLNEGMKRNLKDLKDASEK